MIVLVAYAVEILILLAAVAVCFLLFRYLIRSPRFARFVANTGTPEGDLEANLDRARGDIHVHLREGELEAQAAERARRHLIEALNKDRYN